LPYSRAFQGNAIGASVLMLQIALKISILRISIIFRAMLHPHTVTSLRMLTKAGDSTRFSLTNQLSIELLYIYTAPNIFVNG
jgi:hypothetical protein